MAIIVKDRANPAVRFEDSVAGNIRCPIHIIARIIAPRTTRNTITPNRWTLTI